MKRYWVRALLACAVMGVNVGVRAEDAGKEPAVVALPPVTVTVENREEDLQKISRSVTVIDGKRIEDAGITRIDQAARFAPNVVISEFTNRRLSFPFVRGVGSGRNSPAVTTYIDGVPQLSFATSNVELTNVDRIEFARGPQGTLYGRNTLGGVINVHTNRPTNQWIVAPQATWGNYDLQDYRATVSGPIVKDQVFFGFSGGFMSREGYTTNDFTGHDLDNREGEFGTGQLLWTPTANVDVRLSLLGQRDRDGDYALGDLSSVRAMPHHVSHDFEGSSKRDVLEPALTVTARGDGAEFTSVSAWQYWKSRDVTDLDTSPADFIRRNNDEDQRAFTQEFRVGTPGDKPVKLSEDVKLHWQAGLYGFSSAYDQRAFNDYRPGAVGVIPGIFFPFKQFGNTDLNDWGVAAYGQATATFWDKLDVTAGARYDYEHKQGRVSSFGDSPFIPVAGASGSEDFDQVTTRLAVGYHWTEDLLTYASAAQGFKAGGFNDASAPAGNFAFGPEKSWTYEAGIKKSWLNNRIVTNFDVFYIDWKNLQLDVPTGTPGVFYIDNAGQATSKGAEFELTVRPIEGLDVFAGVGLVDGKFNSGSASGGSNVGGNYLPFAPDMTFNAGTQYTVGLPKDLKGYVRADVFGVGRYFYDASNAAQQPTYWLADFRVGVRGEHWHAEGWIRNAFDQNYVPLAFPFGLASSGYVGEAGSPQTYGVTVGVEY